MSYANNKLPDNVMVTPDTSEEVSALFTQESSLTSNSSSKEFASDLPDATRIRREISDNFARSVGTGALIGLDEVIQANPLESEAESHIIRSLEDRDPNVSPLHSDQTFNTPTLLSNVPDCVLHSFEANPPLISQGQRSHTGTVASGSSRPKPTIPLRRQNVEQELAGLTTALRAFHDTDIEHIKSSERDHLGGRLFREAENGPFGAADELAQNASILFHRNTRNCNDDDQDKADTQDTAEHRASQGAVLEIDSAKGNMAKRNWGKISAAISFHPKKNESNDIAEHSGAIDPELGNATSMTSGGSHSNLTNVSDVPRTDNPFFGSLHRPRVGKVVREAAKRTTTEISNDVDIFRAFFRPRKSTVLVYLKSVLFYLIIPALSIAAVLFYCVDNPHTGRQSHRTDSKKQNHGSISWWIIFICVRQVVTLTTALAIQALVVDFFALRTRLTLRLCGPVVTLLLVQSKGLPFTLFCWGLIDMFTLAGPGTFAGHWLFFQPWIGLFNMDNPTGSFVSSPWNYRILAIATGLGLVMALKRVAIGLHLGRRTFANYSRQLTQVMRSMYLISEVATLAKSLQTASIESTAYELRNSKVEAVFGWRERLVTEDDPSGTDVAEEQQGESGNPTLFESSGNGLSSSQRSLIKQALEDWEEPERDSTLPSTISVSAILQFRQALAFMNNDYPFSVAFGLADTRDACIQSSQLVYDNLVLSSSGEEALKFETISVLAKNRQGVIEQKALKDLIRLFRPDREGRLSKIDFIKSVDNVYKSMRLLRASIAAAAKIDFAFESIFNVGFYVVTACVALSVLGFNPLTLFLSLSGVIVSFAFMIGSAAAKYFEGVLFILVRRPYDIGDKIHASNVDANTDPNGSDCWIVDDVTLFTTTVIYGPSNERATMSNGSLAASRIINANRSPKAMIGVVLKFGVNVPYEKVTRFKSVVEQFVKARPREWLALRCFRASKVELNQGFIEYVITVQHRESWQSIGSILNSKADLSSFCLEVMKKMDMGYTSPALPVALTVTESNQVIQQLGLNGSHEQSLDMARSIAKLFPQR